MKPAATSYPVQHQITINMLHDWKLIVCLFTLSFSTQNFDCYSCNFKTWGQFISLYARYHSTAVQLWGIYNIFFLLFKRVSANYSWLVRVINFVHSSNYETRRQFISLYSWYHGTNDSVMRNQSDHFYVFYIR